MSDFDTIRAAIVARIQTVPEIGRVHDCERSLANEGAVRQHYGWPQGASKPEVRGWFVRLASFNGVQDRIGRGRRITTAWQITGFIGFVDADASDLLVQQLVEGIATAFDADTRLGGAVHRCAAGDGPDAPAGIQGDSILPVRLAGVLCHRAILSLPTQHFAR